jgi:competence protein ComEC
MRASSRLVAALIAVLALALCIIAYAVALEDRRGLLTVSFLDVGQGDAVFIDAPSGRQVLIDGGPSARVLRELARVSPWYDRHIDVVLATHPDADHINGLVDILARYDVGTLIRSSVRGETALAHTFEDIVGSGKFAVVTAQRGQVINLGKGARLEILFPDRPILGVEANVGCVVARLTYGDTAFMLPCDAPDEIELYLTRLDRERLKSDVLKAAHHGSKTSSAAAFVGAVAPSYAVFSRGCDNSYGHPHPDVVATYARFDVPTFDTCKDGTITFVSDGQMVWQK